MNPKQAATWRCCQAGGLVLDVGANFGWYTLFSVALGCRALSFEPVPMWREVLRLGVALNHDYGARTATALGSSTTMVSTPLQPSLHSGIKKATTSVTHYCIVRD